MWLSQEKILIKSKASCEVSMSKERQGGHETHSHSKPNQPEQSPQGRATKSPERQQPQTVRNVVEHHQSIHTILLKQRPPLTEEEHERRLNETVELETKIEEKGTDRDWLIYELFDFANFDDPEDRLHFSDYVSPLEYQLFHSALKAFSDEEIAAEADKQDKEYGDRLDWE
jgi:hypothetical protein